MKKFIPILSLAVLTVVFLSCTFGNPFSSISKEEAIVLPADKIDDSQRSLSGPFQYQTLLPVNLTLDVDLYEVTGNEKGGDALASLPTQEEVIIVKVQDSKKNLVYAGRIQPDGSLQTQLQLPAAPEDMTLTLQGEGFKERKVVISDMVNYSEVKRTMPMLMEDPGAKDANLLTDSDLDTIPDVYDAFPNDPKAAFAYDTPAKGHLTIAFEDLFGQASAGDADYNDFVAEYKVTEVADPPGEIIRIKVEVTAIDKIAGYDHVFGMMVDYFEGSADVSGTYIDENGAPQDIREKTILSPPAQIILFENTDVAKGKTANFTLEFSRSQTIDPENPALNEMDRPPYNPYLYVTSTPTNNDIHLMGEQAIPSSNNPGDDFQDEEGFPWALLIPADWIHPDECQRIEVPYPRFDNWRKSFGAEHTDWYLHNDPYVPEPTVYVAGYYAGTSNDVACYWKNDAGGKAKIDLYDTANASGNDIAAAGGDFYVAGYYNNGSNDVACYWKHDGFPTTPVSPPVVLHSTTAARANAIYIDSSDVYVAGFLDNGSTKEAGYWKGKTDGTGFTWTTLYDSTAAEATDIVFSGTNVYVSGFYQSGIYTYSCYWENGSQIPLYTSNYSQAYAIAVSGTDVYVAGYYINGGVNACYWVRPQNDLVTPPNEETLDSNVAFARDILLSGIDVYVAGYYNNASGKSAACYWLNDAGGLQNLYSDNTNTAEAHGIYVSDGVVYASGFVNEGTKSACYWENGSRVNLYTDGNSSGFSLFVEMK